MTDALPAPRRGGPRHALAIALFTVFLDILGFGIILPIQPFYAESFGASETVVTLLGASFSLMQFLFAPFWGRRSDRLGRRPIILSSLAFTVVGHALFASATSLAMLFSARLIVGLGSANFGAAQAVIADTMRGPDRARGMGLFGAAFGLGFIIGPAVGGALSHISIAAPAWASAGLALAGLLFAWRYLPETHPPEARHPTPTSPRATSWLPALDLPQARRFPNVPLLLVTFAIAIAAQALVEQVLSLLIERAWVFPETGHLSTAAGHQRAAVLTTYTLIVVGVVVVIVQGALIHRLQRRFGERPLLITGSLFAALGTALFIVTATLASFPAFLVAGALFAIGVGLTTPSFSAALSRSVPDAEQGRWLGLSQSLNALGRTIGPALAGLLFSFAHALPFALATLLFITAGLATRRLTRVRDWTPTP